MLSSMSFHPNTFLTKSIHRRTSSAESSEPLAFEITGMKLPPIKRKGSYATVTPTEPASNFYFLLPSDLSKLTDYYILLYSQVKRCAMNAADAASGNRKNNNVGVGFLGLCCRHCGGRPKGSYFPTSSKNLQATPPTMSTHLLKCTSCPDIIKRSLKLAKSKHKQDMIKMKSGAITSWYSEFWKRIQDPEFNGEAHTKAIRERLNQIEKICAPSPSTNGTEIQPFENTADEQLLPHIVSYEELESDPLLHPLSLPLATDSEPTDSDWEMTLELLRRPPTPNSQINLQYPPEAMFNPNPVYTRAPIPVRISESGELYHNGEFVIEDYSLPPPFEPKLEAKHTQKKKKIKEEQVGETRKFTRSDEVNLVKGILKHGQKWKGKPLPSHTITHYFPTDDSRCDNTVAIWNDEPELQHIYYSALKDRARSKRFQTILAKAEADPTLVNNPEALCGSDDQPEYMNAEEGR